MEGSLPLVLASTSRYRAALLARLQLACECAAPGVQETHLAGEPPATRAARLAEEKGKAVAARMPARWVLGGDQVCALGSRILDKPETLPNARRQLCALSGQRAVFHTAICLRHAASNRALHAMDHTFVQFRTLSAAEIDRYLAAEDVLDCAGSFKCEGLGISLFEAIETADPTALVGLPLIATRRLLAAAGIAVP
ncbi:MAG: septum formation protein Maf [Nevskiaceae bacterium]|nr:MAG: septum formation protein Maf [Nevskiaceae bacterium]TBR73325.1 MAG: septum formation protein Maf [Nevskiaceae bacterium]